MIGMPTWATAPDNQKPVCWAYGAVHGSSYC
jgi:hypothetical protein